MSAEPVSLVVRNTFIDAVPGEGQTEEDALGRTQSDPTGGRSKQVLTLGRIPRARIREGTKEEEAGDDESFETFGIEDPMALGPGHDEEEDEEEDDMPLARTKSVAHPGTAYPGLPGLGRTLSAASAGDPVSPNLQRLLTGGGEDETFASAMPPMGGYNPGGYMPAMMPWGMYPAPYGMQPSPWNAMMPYGLEHGVDAPAGQVREGEVGEEEEEEEQGGAKSEAAQGKPLGAAEALPMMSSQAMQDLLPELGTGPPLGNRHNFHQETKDMGIVSPDFRQFTKVGYEGRLSVVSESRVHNDGVQRYLVQFTSGELSRADGVGFVFSQRLPCAKNIQRIVSIFVNQRGRICMRVFADIVRASAYVKPLELGDWVEMAVDLEKQVCTFNIWARTPSGWPPLTGKPASTADFTFGNKMSKLNQNGQKPVKLNVGHLACVVKNVGVTVTLFS